MFAGNHLGGEHGFKLYDRAFDILGDSREEMLDDERDSVISSLIEKSPPRSENQEYYNMFTNNSKQSSIGNIILDSDPMREETESMVSDDEATYFRVTETMQS